MKIYDFVYEILEDHPNCRNSDKLLYWKVLEKKDLLYGDFINFEGFMSAPNYGTVERVRQKIQELHPHLRPTDSKIIARRHKKELEKGTFIYREKL